MKGLFFGCICVVLGCPSSKETPGEPAGDTAEWWEEPVEDDTDTDDDGKPDDTADGKPDDTADGKPDDSGDGAFDVDDCAEDFDPALPCEGDWLETLCVYDGLLWWCEDGVWLNEDDKPD